MLGRNSGRRRVRSTVVAVALLGAVSACGDSTAPWSEFDPGRAVDRLDQVLTPLAGDGDFLLNLDLATSALAQYSGAEMASALALRTDGSDGMLRALRADRQRGKLRSGGDAPAAPADTGTSAFTIPWELSGETLEWDPVYGYVVSGHTGAPTNGVRILLYRMDHNSGYPAEPLVRIGHVDLTDEDNAQAEAVRVRAVRTTGSDRVIADYRVSLTGAGSYEEGSMTVRTQGDIAQAGSVTLDLTQRLEWSRTRDRDELTLDYSYRQGSRSVVLEGRALSRYDALEWETFDFSTEFRGERPVTAVEAVVGRTGTVTGAVLSDGRRVALIRGHDGSPTFERADGGQLSWSERGDLEQIWSGITDLLWWTDWVMIPADLLVLGG